MEKLRSAFVSLFEVNMGIAPGERIVVFSDIIRPDESPDAGDLDRRLRLHATARGAAEFGAEAYGSTAFVDFPATAASGAEPPELLWREVFGAALVEELKRGGLLERLLAKEATPADQELAEMLVEARRGEVAAVVIAMANNSTSHTRFRHLVNVAGGRFASLPHFDPEMFFSSMAVDWQVLAQRTTKLAAAVNCAERLRISTPNGTKLSFSMQGRRAEGDDGLLTAPGSFGNLPAGEVYLAPLEGTAEGELVIEYAPTRKLASPLHLVVRQGEVVEVVGDEPYREWLEGKFAASGKNRNIAELGIGTNDRASRPDNILEAEKILGTIHVALGDNSGFGGTVSTPFHEDYVFYRPTVTALLPGGGERLLLDDGRLCE
ncbi:MAG TPA: aminopeptidase [Geobacteraceae bacterium]|nr:aminopeptidase [Geobacteraceae bacterium]